MSDQVGDRPAAQLRAAVERWSARDVRQRRGDAFGRGALWMLGVGALAAAARSAVWPSTEPHLATNLSRAAALGLGATLLASLVAGLVIVLGVRRRPRRAARAMDARLEDPNETAFGASCERGADVIRNGWALIEVAGPGAALAVRHAAHAAERAGPPPRPGRPVRWARALLAGGLGLAGMTVGALDEHVVRVLVSPPSPEELAAADRMAEAARANTEADLERADRARALARRAADAVRRGDRDAALQTLSRMQREMRAQAARRGDRERDLQAIARTFGALTTRRPSPSERGSAPPDAPRAAQRASARADSLSRLLRRDREGSPSADPTAARRRLLERLQRARTEASRQAARSPEDRHARALSRHLDDAVRHLERGDPREASEAMAQAARALERREASLARAVEQAQRDAPVHRQAEAVARALQRTRTGQGHAGDRVEATAPSADPPGDDGPRALSSAIASRLAALGLSEGSASSGGGGRRSPDVARRGAAPRWRAAPTPGLG